MSQLSVRASTSKLEVLTPNEKEHIIKQERSRRRIIRYIQVRKQSNQNALKIRDKVKAGKRREVERIKEELTDAVVHRYMLRPILSPVQINFTEKLISPPHRRCRKLTAEEIRLIEKRNKDALLKLKKQREEQRAKLNKAINLRRKAVKEANMHSKRILKQTQ